jgi:hypothetical protein
MPLGAVRSGSKIKRTLGLFLEEPSEDDTEGLLGIVDVLLAVLITVSTEAPLRKL